MNIYYSSMPRDFTVGDTVAYSADVIIRDIGYLPGIGAGVGVPRIIIGVWQKVMGGEGGLAFSEGDGRVHFNGSRQAADGVANIVRGCFECIPFANTIILPLWDGCHTDDRWFLIPGYTCK